MINPTEIKSAEEMELIAVLAYIEMDAAKGARYTRYWGKISEENITKLSQPGYYIGPYESEIIGREITW